MYAKAAGKRPNRQLIDDKVCMAYIVTWIECAKLAGNSLNRLRILYVPAIPNATLGPTQISG